MSLAHSGRRDEGKEEAVQKKTGFLKKKKDDKLIAQRGIKEHKEEYRACAKVTG